MMNVMQKAGEAREYQDFAPQTELLVQPDCDTLLVYVSGNVIFAFSLQNIDRIFCILSTIRKMWSGKIHNRVRPQRPN